MGGVNAASLRFLFVASQRSCLKTGDEICIERREALKPSNPPPFGREERGECNQSFQICNRLTHTHTHTLSLSMRWVNRLYTHSERWTH